ALPLLTAHLAHPDAAVATYAAVAIERLLVLKLQGALRVGAAEVQPHAAAMLTHIFAALARADSPQKLADNDYLMKTVMRVFLACRAAILPLAPPALAALARILAEVSKNPSNPRFSHFMFEALAALARFACAADAAAIGQFEATLFPIFQDILQQDVAEFMPYVFQILAQLLSVHAGAARLPDAYVALLPPLLQPALWAAHGNVPALVRLLQSYLQIGGAQLAAEGQIQPVLGVFQRLCASRANDHHGFALLLAITLYVPPAALAGFLRPVLVLCLNRMQASRTPKFVRNFAHYLAAVMCLRADADGVALLLDALDAVQPGLLASLLQSVLLDAIPTVVGRVERKATVVGFGALVASPRFQASPACAALTAPLLAQLATVLMDAGVKDSKAQADQPTVDGSAPSVAAAAATADEDLDSLEIEDSGYQASYARLATLGDAKIDPCPQFADAASGLAQVLKPAQSTVAAAAQQLPAEVRQFLSTLLS
ncbi:importin-alpha export receptor, partial [Coemansia erecta]